MKKNLKTNSLVEKLLDAIPDLNAGLNLKFALPFLREAEKANGMSERFTEKYVPFAVALSVLAEEFAGLQEGTFVVARRSPLEDASIRFSPFGELSPDSCRSSSGAEAVGRKMKTDVLNKVDEAGLEGVSKTFLLERLSALCFDESLSDFDSLDLEHIPVLSSSGVFSVTVSASDGTISDGCSIGGPRPPEPEKENPKKELEEEPAANARYVPTRQDDDPKPCPPARVYMKYPKEEPALKDVVSNRYDPEPEMGI